MGKICGYGSTFQKIKAFISMDLIFREDINCQEVIMFEKTFLNSLKQSQIELTLSLLSWIQLSKEINPEEIRHSNLIISMYNKNNTNRKTVALVSNKTAGYLKNFLRSGYKNNIHVIENQELLIKLYESCLSINEIATIEPAFGDDALDTAIDEIREEQDFILRTHFAYIKAKELSIFFLNSDFNEASQAMDFQANAFFALYNYDAEKCYQELSQSLQIWESTLFSGDG